jgi:hypothetical protein
MSQVGKIIPVTTVAATQFRSALAQNAGENLSLDVNSYGVGIRVDSIIRTLQIMSVEDRQWELWFYGKNSFNASVNPDVNTRNGWYWFGVSGRQIGAAGLYHFYVDGLYVPYRDLDQTGKIHMTLINRSAGAKSAGDAGALRVILGIEMALGV